MRGRCKYMIIQPEIKNWKEENKYFYESERQHIAVLNEIFGEIDLSEEEQSILAWIAGWDDRTVNSLSSAIRKVIAAETKRLETSHVREKQK